MALTRMPCFASSNASVRVSETMPAFVTSYCPMPARVDVGTGQVSFLDYVAVHDCGTLVNPMTLAGMFATNVSMSLAAGRSRIRGTAWLAHKGRKPARGVAIRPD